MAIRNLTKKIRGFILATHFGPTVLVVTISFLLAKTQFSTKHSLEIAIAILAGQCVVGWSNDLIDFPLDLAAKRMKKPLVAGSITPGMLKPAIAIALTLAMIFSYLGPLGFKGTAIHALGLISATLYNVKLKRTWISALPYFFSFAAMPWAIYISAEKHPPLWLWMGFALFACAFHFLNVMKDLTIDIEQCVLGLPQRMGRTRSFVFAALFVLCAIAIVILNRGHL
jgi:4-hydroxybenzoate polyprenyltransferase